jgi:hypothetical protein
MVIKPIEEILEEKGYNVCYIGKDSKIYMTIIKSNLEKNLEPVLIPANLISNFKGDSKGVYAVYKKDNLT